MPCINFTEKKIFKPLIEKKKLQTIRAINDKGPRMKVGDICKIFWHQRSGNKFYCKRCSTAFKNTIISGSKCNYCGSSDFIGKVLGKVKITDVREIKIKKVKTHGRKQHDDYRFIIKDKYGTLNIAQVEQLAIDDGFETSYDMFEFFDTNYDIRNSREFAIYYFQWL